MDGLNGFTTLRTRPIQAPDKTEKRRCEKCGAVLRQSNPGPLCMPCEQPLHISDLMIEIARCDDRPATTDALVAMILGAGRKEQQQARIAAIYEGRKAGLSVQQLAAAHGMTDHQVRHIVSEHKGRG